MLECDRLGEPDGRFPIFDPAGSVLFPGRWNTPRSPMVYAAEVYSTALLEKLVHGNGRMPRHQHFIRITIPNGVSYKVLNPVSLKGWDTALASVSRMFGHAWHLARRSAILIVPSVVARPDRNVLINLEHPDARAITQSFHEPIWWDERLFGR
ncbi:MAG: RES domain-containing protein [Microvirga sp.]